MQKHFKAIIINIAIILFSGLSVFSTVPKIINFQGVLKDSNGKAVSGTKKIVFNIYKSETGGSSLLKLTKNADIDATGVYNVELDVSSLPFDKQYYLGVNVDGDGEMKPRYKITSAAYSINASNAEELNGKNPSYYLDYDNFTNTPPAGACDFAVQLNDVNVSSPTIAIDFNSSHFLVTQGPASEANISIATAPYATQAGSIADDSVDSDQIASNAVQDDEMDYTAVTLADFTNDESFIKADGTVNMAANLDLNVNKIVNLSTPTTDTDAATKYYVDTVAGGGSPVAILKATQPFTGKNTFRNLVTISSSAVISGDVTVGGIIGASGALSGATLNTGQGATEVYAMNQAVRTTDTVIFSSVTAKSYVLTGGVTYYYYNIPGSAFIQKDRMNHDKCQPIGYQLYISTGNADPVVEISAYAPVQLPAGAKIAQVTIFYYDDDGTNSITDLDCSLAYKELGTTGSTNIAETFDITTFGDDPADQSTNLTINNAGPVETSWLIYAGIDNFAGNDYSTSMGIQGMRIKYYTGEGERVIK
ncbi:hypothetical protein ACFLUV_01005 [Elusimicrobiota bacterium]